MILRGLFAASLSVLLSGASLAGVVSAFDWHKPAPPDYCCGPTVLPAPPYLMEFNPEAPHWSCPRQSQVDRDARPIVYRPAAAPTGRPAPGDFRSPNLCALIGANGRIAALTATTGGSPPDPRLARLLRGMTFRPALRNGHPVAAWHRLTIYPGPLRTLPHEPGRLYLTTEYQEVRILI